LNRQLSRRLDSVVLRGLAEEPKGRFPTVREFVTAFDQALAAPPRKARWLPLAGAGLIAVLLAALGLKWIAGAGSKRDGPITPNRVAVKPVVNPTAANPVKPNDAGRPPDPAAKTPERSPDFDHLVKLRAYVIWVKCGRPTGAAGESVKEKNWLEAERQILDEVKARAFTIWDKQGRPSGAAGEAVREKNMRAAEAQLLKETEEEMNRHPVD